MALDDLFRTLAGEAPMAQTPPDNLAVAPAAAPAAAAPAGDDRSALGKQIFEYFRGKGLSPEQAAAVAGNMVWESGGNPSNVTAGDNIRGSPRSPHSVGLGQWNDRAPSLIAFARAQGVEIPEGNTGDANYMRNVIKRIPLNTQLDFAWTEMQGPERRAFGMISNAGSLDEAVKGGISYHRPAGWTWSNPAGGHGFAQREGIAKQILASAATNGSPAAAVADRFGDWPGVTAPQSNAAPVTAAAAPTGRSGMAAASPMSGLFDTSQTGGDALQIALQNAIKKSEQQQESSNAVAAADPVLKMPLKQADLRSVLELIQRSAGRPLGTMGA